MQGVDMDYIWSPNLCPTQGSDPKSLDANSTSAELEARVPVFAESQGLQVSLGPPLSKPSLFGPSAKIQTVYAVGEQSQYGCSSNWRPW